MSTAGSGGSAGLMSTAGQGGGGRGGAAGGQGGAGRGGAGGGSGAGGVTATACVPESCDPTRTSCACDPSAAPCNTCDSGQGRQLRCTCSAAGRWTCVSSFPGGSSPCWPAAGCSLPTGDTTCEYCVRRGQSWALSVHEISPAGRSQRRLVGVRFLRLPAAAASTAAAGNASTARSASTSSTPAAPVRVAALAAPAAPRSRARPPAWRCRERAVASSHRARASPFRTAASRSAERPAAARSGRGTSRVSGPAADGHFTPGRSMPMRMAPSSTMP